MVEEFGGSTWPSRSPPRRATVDGQAPGHDPPVHGVRRRRGRPGSRWRRARSTPSSRPRRRSLRRRASGTLEHRRPARGRPRTSAASAPCSTSACSRRRAPAFDHGRGVLGWNTTRAPAVCSSRSRDECEASRDRDQALARCTAKARVPFDEGRALDGGHSQIGRRAVRNARAPSAGRWTARSRRSRNRCRSSARRKSPASSVRRSARSRNLTCCSRRHPTRSSSASHVRPTRRARELAEREKVVPSVRHHRARPSRTH